MYFFVWDHNLKLIGTVSARNAVDAIVVAKSAGTIAPMVRPTKCSLQRSEPRPCEEWRNFW